MEIKSLRWYELLKNVTSGGEVPLHVGCNGWTAINRGDDIATVNGITCLPRLAVGLSGESVSAKGEVGEIYTKETLTVTFATTTNPLLQIIQKVYEIPPC